MISDTLHDAIGQIKKYQRERPEVYDALRPYIDIVIEAKELLRHKLDVPPGQVTH